MKRNAASSNLFVPLIGAAVVLLTCGTALAQTMPLRGRISFFGTFQSSTFESGASHEFSETTLAVSFRTRDTGQSGVLMAVDLRGTAYPSSEGRSSRTRIFDAWAGGRTAGGRVMFRAGQMWLHELGGIGSLGGVMGEVKKKTAAGDLRFGIFGGMEPERFDVGFVSKVKKGGGWLAFDGARNRRHVVGYVMIRDENLTERSVVTTTNYIPAGKSLVLYQTAEFDLTGPGGEGEGGLNYVFANARFTPVKRVELMANYHHGRSIDARRITQDILEGRAIPQSALDGFLYETAGGRVTVEIVRGLRAYAGYARDRNNRDEESSGRITAGLWASNIARSGFDLSISDNRIDRPDRTYDAWHVSLGRSLGPRLYLSADYSNSLSVLRVNGPGGTIETRPRSKRYGLSGVWNVNRTVSFTFSGEQLRDDLSEDDRGMLGMTYRF